MCPFYNAQLFEITGAAKGVFTLSQSSCHIAKVVLTIRHDSRQIPLAARHHTFPHRGFLVWALSRRHFNRRQGRRIFFLRARFFVPTCTSFSAGAHRSCQGWPLSRLAVAPTLSDKLRRCQATP